MLSKKLDLESKGEALWRGRFGRKQGKEVWLLEAPLREFRGPHVFFGAKRRESMVMKSPRDGELVV